MHGQPRGCHRSVERGTCRPGIELRNNRDRSADVVPHGGRLHRGVRHRKHLEDSAQSETPRMHRNSTRENRETPSVPVTESTAGRLEKAMSQESDMYAGGESDGCVLPSKCPNKGGQPPAEGMEGRQPTKENIGQATAPRTQSRISELSGLLGVRKAARKDKRTRFTALLHHVTVNLLRDSYYTLKRDATAQQLGRHTIDLQDLMKSGHPPRVEKRLSSLYRDERAGEERKQGCKPPHRPYPPPNVYS